MYTAIRSLTAALLIAAMAIPSLGAPGKSEAGQGRHAGTKDPESVLVRESATVERQQKIWSHLSASICAGCITAANRVAPSTYERTEPSPIAGARVIAAANVEHIKTALRSNPTPRKFVTLKKHYAKLHRRDRKRLAARRHQLRLALRAKRHAAHLAAIRRKRLGIVQARFVPAYRAGSEKRVYRVPVDQFGLPPEGGRAYETIIPTLVRLQRS